MKQDTYALLRTRFRKPTYERALLVLAVVIGAGSVAWLALLTPEQNACSKCSEFTIAAVGLAIAAFVVCLHVYCVTTRVLIEQIEMLRGGTESKGTSAAPSEKEA